jgi:hypothetical protein
MLMPEADGSNDKKVSFSAIWNVVGEPLLSQLPRFWTSGRLTGSYPASTPGLVLRSRLLARNATVTASASTGTDAVSSGIAFKLSRSKPRIKSE